MHFHIGMPKKHTEIPMSLDPHSTVTIISDVLLLKKNNNNKIKAISSLLSQGYMKYKDNFKQT